MDEVPANKTDDFSLHQAPTSNLLKEIKQLRHSTVDVLACQSKWIPAEIASGLSPEVASAVGRACDMIADRLAEMRSPCV